MSTSPIVNPVPVEDAAGWVRQVASGLLHNPYDDDFHSGVERRRRAWISDRTWGVRERGQWVATLRTEPRTLSVPGPAAGTRDVAVDALTGVTVAATHRRRGLLTDMIGRSLAAAKDRGDPLSTLVAVEWPIYGRFGYAPASFFHSYCYRPRRSGLAVAVDRSRVRQVDPDELAPIADAVFDASRRLRAGQVDRFAPWWDRQLGQDGYRTPSGSWSHWFVHDGPDGPDGVLGWKVTRELDFVQGAALEVTAMFTTSEQAERDLWGYLSGVDAVDEILLPVRPVDEPARWYLHDGRALQPTESGDFLWVRLLDVPAALQARSYAADGEVVLDVVDETTGRYAAGRVLLTVHDGTAECRPTDRDPHLRLDARTLASMYLGGVRLPALAPAQRPEELTAGTIDRLDLMFSTPLAPWTQTIF